MAPSALTNSRATLSSIRTACRGTALSSGGGIRRGTCSAAHATAAHLIPRSRGGIASVVGADDDDIEAVAVLDVEAEETEEGTR